MFVSEVDPSMSTVVKQCIIWIQNLDCIIVNDNLYASHINQLMWNADPAKPERLIRGHISARANEMTGF